MHYPDNITSNCQMKFFLKWKCLFLTVLLVVGSPKGVLPLFTPCDELYHYREVTGTVIKEVAWHLTKGDCYRLVCISPAERHVTITDGNYNTLRWEMMSADGKTQLVAERRGRTITICGCFEGKPMNKVLCIDDSPWYQATSLSMRGFIDSDETECIFWTIRLKTLNAYKIKAIKKEVEQFEANKVHLLRIRLTLPGVLAPLWKCDYWFDFPAGVFFRFQGPSGPPGSPTTTITRVVG